MPQTIAVQGTDKVMAECGSPGTYIIGKWRLIRVTGVSPDESMPRSIREALVGLEIATIFTGSELSPELNPTAQFAYVPEVIEALKKAGKNEAAQELCDIASSPRDMYEFEPEIFEGIG